MPQTPEDLAKAVEWGYKALTGDRIAEYAKYRNYYDGVQEMEFATDKFSNTFGDLFKTFAYNRCGTVVDSIADRLQLLGFTPTGIDENESPKEFKALKDEADLIFRQNRMDRLQGEQIQETLKCGDAYVIVWPDKLPDGTIYPAIYVNMADTVAIRYDDETRKPLYAVKIWRREDKFWRFTLYFPDAIYKFVSTAATDEMPKKIAALAPYEAVTSDGAAEPWPLPNIYNRIPVFHFPNNTAKGQYGRSVLKSILPLQDALNKACMDMMVAMEYGAYPQRWATGLQLGRPNPLTGKVDSPFKEGPGETWTAPNGASFGNFEVANLEQFTKVQESFDTKIANVARIPGHWFNMFGTPPSGESLKTAEAPFVALISDAQIFMGNDWEDVFEFGFVTIGRDGLSLDANWKSAELRSDTDKLQEGLLKKQLGWSTDQIMREYGLPQSVIDRMADENLAKMQEAMANASAGLVGSAGLPPTSGAATATRNSPPTNSKDSGNNQGA